MKKLYTLFLLNALLVNAQNPTCRDDSNTLYGVGSGTGGRVIYSMSMSGNALTYNGVFAGNVPVGCGSLAIADLGDGDKFYSNDYNGNIYKSDGTTWSVVLTGAPAFFNAAGKGNNLYFHSTRLNATTENRISRFDGTTLTTLWDDPTVYSPFADIVVDNVGNVYFFTGSSAYDVNKLNIMSPTGAMLQQIPMSFEGFNGYGACFLNDIVYLTFGDANSTYPNKMLPITVSGSTATLGTPIVFPRPVIGTSSSGPIYLAMSDLASCSSANIVLSNANFELDTDFNVYANANQLTIHSKYEGTVVIFNSIGQKVTSFQVHQNIESIEDISNYANGIYFVNFNFDGKTAIKKFLKH